MTISGASSPVGRCRQRVARHDEVRQASASLHTTDGAFTWFASTQVYNRVREGRRLALFILASTADAINWLSDVGEDSQRNDSGVWL